MSSNNSFINAGEVPNNFQLSIYTSDGSNNYRLSEEQNAIYHKLNGNVQTNYYYSFVSSFLGYTLSAICIILLFFKYTRKYAFIALCLIIIIWLSFAYYLTIKGNKNANKMDELLKP